MVVSGNRFVEELPLSAKDLREAFDLTAGSKRDVVRIYMRSEGAAGEIWLSNDRVLWVRCQPGERYGHDALLDMLEVKNASFSMSLHQSPPSDQRGKISVLLHTIMPTAASSGRNRKAKTANQVISESDDVVNRIQAILTNADGRHSPGFAAEDYAPMRGEKREANPQPFEGVEILESDRRPLNQAEQKLVSEEERLRALAQEERLSRELRGTFDSEKQVVARLVRRAKLTPQTTALAIAVAICLGVFGCALFFWAQRGYSERQDETSARTALHTAAVEVFDEERPQEAFLLPKGQVSGQQTDGGDNDHAGKAYGRDDLVNMQKQLDLAKRLVACGKPTEALEILRQALAKYPRFVMLRIYAIQTMISLGHADEARSLCMEGLNLNPTAAEKDVLQRLLASAR